MERDLQTVINAYVADPSASGREAVVRASMPLVRSLLGKLTLPDSPLATWEDLESAALLGLLQALDSYDPARGVQFVTHAYNRVRGAMLDYLRSIDVVSGERRQRIVEAQRAQATVAQMLGEEPQDEDVADYLGTTVEEYGRLMVEAQTRFVFFAGSGDDDADADLMVEQVEDPSAGLAFQGVEDSVTMGQLRKLIARLPEREQTILALHHYEGLTLREIGTVLGISDARVAQVMGRTLLKLQHALEDVPM